MPIRPGGRGTGRGRPAFRTIASAVPLLLAIALVAGACGTTPVPAPTAIAAGPSASPSPSPAAPSSPSATPSPSPSASPSPAPSPTPTPSPPPAVPAAALQARLEAVRAKLGIPGVSVAILWDDGRSWLGAAGMRNVAMGAVMKTDTAFALASVSKTFTAAVVLQLVEDGRLRLDEPVAPWLPALRLDRRITVRMLLDHTSGLPDFFLNRRIDRALQSDPGARWSLERTMGYVKKKRERPGSTWAYSNTNYLLLGELVRAVTGRSLATEIRARLLKPLGLEDAWYQADEKPRLPGTLGYRLVARADGTVRAVAVAERSDVMPFRSVVTAAGGAGSMASTALDAARWMRAFVAGDVLGPDMRREMLIDAGTTYAMGARVPYGLGVQVVDVGGRTAIGHSGRYLGFRNVVRYLPVEGVTIAVLTNQGAADPARIARALLRVALPPLPSPVPPPSPSPSPSTATPTPTPAP